MYNNILYNKNKTTLILCPRKKAGSYNIPDSVTDIQSRAFDTCEQLTSVTIPDGVTEVAREVFAHYRELEKIGLAAPQITYIMHDLAAKGIAVDVHATTVEEAKKSILEALAGKGACR